MPRAFLVVHGVVQGVGYRYHVMAAARKHSIRGFVRNVSDGSVEILADYENIGKLEGFIRDINVDTNYGPQVFQIEKDERRLKEFEQESFEKFDIMVL